MSILLSSRLQPLRLSGREARLSFSPQYLTIVEVVQVIFIFVLRQLFHLLSLGNDISSIDKDGTSAVLPDVRLSMPFRLSRDGLKGYAKAVDLSDTSTSLNTSAQTCLLLSAFSEPAMLLLLASRGCPILPLGAVNVKNKFEILIPRLCTEEALLNMEKAELRARILSKTRKVKRGLEIDLQVDVVNLDEDMVIFRQVFTMLQFMRWKDPRSAAVRDTAGEVADDDWNQAHATSFEMILDAPLAWARICKDYNLLHISSLAAKIFGFSGRIAHGNHALAMGIARLGSEGQSTMWSFHGQGRSNVMEVHFRKPMALPATLSAQVLVEGETTRFRVSKANKTCVVASMNA